MSIVKIIQKLALPLAFMVTAGCADQIHSTWAYSFEADCVRYAQMGNYTAALRECDKAHRNADRASLNDYDFARIKYNYGMILRTTGNYSQSIRILKEYIEIEQKLTGAYGPRVGFGHRELGFAYFRLNQIKSGIKHVDHLLLMAHDFETEKQRLDTSALFYLYAEKLSEDGYSERAERYRSKIRDLGFEGVDFKEMDESPL